MHKSLLKHISGSKTASGIFRMLFGYDSPELRREVMDLDFRNPVGIAPGFDPSAEFYNAASAAGYGFVVIGPLCFTRKEGVKAAVDALRGIPAHNTLIGLDITKAPGSSSEEDIAKDFLDAFDYSYDFSDFTVIDISDEALGPVRDSAFIKALTDPLIEARMAYDSYHPLIMRLSAVLRPAELPSILDYCLMNGIDGVMLPGEALVKHTAEFSKGRLPIIAEGRIGIPSRAAALFEAGASLVAVQCTPQRFKPELPKAILKSLKKK